MMTSEDILARLVAFDTVSARSNLPLIDWVEQYLGDLGVAFTRVPDPDQPKASLFVTVGPAERNGICLSGHTDVVPVEGQAWTSDPFTLTARDGRLYGRGTCDMKGFLACCLAKLPAMQAEPLTTPLHLLLSYDEETTCEGVLPAIRRMGQDLPRPRAVLVGEPTQMQVANAHKGGAGYKTYITGRDAHSSNPELGSNALVAGAMIVQEIERLAADLRTQPDPSGLFHPPYATTHVGIFQSGQARNIVAPHAYLNWEVRCLPGQDPDDIPRRVQAFVDSVVLPYLRRTAPEATVVTETQFVLPGVRPEPEALAETLALALTRSNRTIAVSYGTEGGQFQHAGLPTVICGPGSIEQAHKPDEWIATAELRRCEAFLDDLIARCRTGIA